MCKLNRQIPVVFPSENVQFLGRSVGYKAKMRFYKCKKMRNCHATPNRTWAKDDLVMFDFSITNACMC